MQLTLQLHLLSAKKRKEAKAGSKTNSKKTIADWYQVCDDYYNLGTTMSKAQFLKSDRTADKFSGTQSEQQTFCTIYEKYLQTRFPDPQHQKDLLCASTLPPLEGCTPSDFLLRLRGQ